MLATVVPISREREEGMELEAADPRRPVRSPGWSRLGRAKLGLALTCALLVALSVATLVAPVDYTALGDYGYLGVFLVTLLATGLVILPVPYLAVIVAAGTYLDPWSVGLVAGVAAAIGELSGYAIGASGRNVLPDNHWHRWLDRNMRRMGAPVIFIGSLVPNPIFDAIGVVAGITRLPLWQFLLVCFVGKTIRFCVLALAGAAYF